MNPDPKPVTGDSLEEWLTSQPDIEFPRLFPGGIEKSFSEKYRQIREILGPVQDEAETRARLVKTNDLRKRLTAEVAGFPIGNRRNPALVKTLLEDGLVCLNNHGRNHVERVILRATQLMRESKGFTITPYEAFILLCAIQLHDVGVITGHENHESRIKEIAETLCIEIVPDKFERNCIVKVATVHAGIAHGTKDTITDLGVSDDLRDQQVRSRKLAAILRFADELADDYSRVAKKSETTDPIPVGSQIYHHYSDSLRTVKVSDHEVILGFDLSPGLALAPIPVSPHQEKYLLDEIYDRTLRVERERRYCMRFLRPDISIDRLVVQIEILNANGLIEPEPIRYRLEELGYPSEPQAGNIKHFEHRLPSGEEERKYLKKIWKNVPTQLKTPVPSAWRPSQPNPISGRATRAATDAILIVTVTKIEATMIMRVFCPSARNSWPRKQIGDKTYYELGVHGGATVFMVQSEMGTATPGGALQTVGQAIQALRPQAVIMCGIAFGLHPDKQKLGDILVAQQIENYEPEKLNLKSGDMPRGDRTTSATRLLDRFHSGDNDWRGAKTHFGLVLSGEKLVNDPEFRARLLTHEPEAIGGEMEGAGMYLAAREAKVDWILVKAICDWADGTKNDAAQQSAARNAAKFVSHVLGKGGWAGPRNSRRRR